jgi:hypothetical protein
MERNDLLLHDFIGAYVTCPNSCHGPFTSLESKCVLLRAFIVSNREVLSYLNAKVTLGLCRVEGRRF